VTRLKLSGGGGEVVVPLLMALPGFEGALVEAGLLPTR